MKPSHVDFHPEIVSLDAKIRTLDQRKTDLETRIRQAARQSEDSIGQLLADPVGSLTRDEDQKQLSQELTHIQEAIKQLATQRQTHVSTISREMCVGLNSDYKKLVRKVLESARDLEAANRAVSDFFTTLNDNGYSTGTLRVMGCLNVDDVEIFAKECREYGFLNEKDNSRLSGVITAEPPMPKVAAAAARRDWFE